jgi:hypothetical protein
MEQGDIVFIVKELSILSRRQEKEWQNDVTGIGYYCDILTEE